MKTFGQRLRAIRIEKGLSQQELADRVGYKSRSAITKIESDARDISQSKVAAFARALDTTTAVLMGERETKTRPDNQKIVQMPTEYIRSML